jgi:hypothetical protein
MGRPMRHISASVASSPMFMTGGKCPYTPNTINKVVSNKDVLKPSTNGIYIIGYSGISSRFIQHYRV